MIINNPTHKSLFSEGGGKPKILLMKKYTDKNIITIPPSKQIPTPFERK